MTLLPCWAKSRITRSASAPSGTLSTKVVLIWSPYLASTALRPRSWAKVQPASPTGPTYTQAAFRGSAFAASAAGAGAGAASSFLPQPTKAAEATRPRAAALSQVRFWKSVMWTPGRGVKQNGREQPEIMALSQRFCRRSSARVKRFADGLGHVGADPERVARNQDQHHHGGQVGQHGQELARDVDAHALQMELHHGQPTKQVSTKQNTCRSPGGEGGQGQRDPALAGDHALDPQWGVHRGHVGPSQTTQSPAHPHRQQPDAAHRVTQGVGRRGAC